MSAHPCPIRTLSWRTVPRCPVALVLACVLTIALAAPPTGRAFEVLEGGPRWPTGAGPFKINPNFPDVALSGSPDDQEEILLCGATAWRDQSRADFRFDYRGLTTVSRINANDGTNAIFYSSADGGDALAATFLAADGDVIVSFDIVFFGKTNGVSNKWRGPGEPAAGEYDIQGVITHELGHALGLDHTPVLGATMYASAAGRALPMRTLAADDREGVEFVYGTRTPAAPAVEISAVLPTEGPKQGGNEVIIEGLNFSYPSDTVLSIAGDPVPRTSWTVESCGRIRIASMPAHAAGSVAIRVENGVGTVTLQKAYVYQSSPATFVRGDANGDDQVNITDTVFLLDHLFRGQVGGPCEDADDANDDGDVDVSDAVTVLLYLFQSGTVLPPPFPQAGTDPTADALGCGS